MTKAEIKEGVIDVIISFSIDTPRSFILDSTKISDYVDPNDRFIMGSELKTKFSQIDENDIQMKLFSSVKKVKDLIKHINNIYNPNEAGV